MSKMYCNTGSYSEAPYHVYASSKASKFRVGALPLFDIDEAAIG